MSDSEAKKVKTPEKPNPVSSSCTPKRPKNFDFWTQKKNLKSIGGISDITSEGLVETALRFRVSWPSENSATNTKVFKFHAMDHSGEISVAAFHDLIPSTMEVIKFNEIFEMQNFDVCKENADYQNLSGHEYQIVIRKATSIKKIDDDGSIPKIMWKFVQLDKLTALDEKAKFDTCAIITNVWPSETKTTPRGESLFREVSITDKTKTMATMVLWGSLTTKFDGVQPGTSIAIRKAWVGHYNNEIQVNISASGTLMLINSDLPQAMDLLKWFNSQASLD